jgi:hypothetical protein
MPRSAGPWMRTVTTPLTGTTPGFSASMQHTEYLDMDKAVERLWEAMRDRPDSSLRDKLDCALNGWADES